MTKLVTSIDTKNVNIDGVLAEWEIDGKPDTLNPQAAIVDIPRIHGKYLRYMASAKKHLRQIYMATKTLKRIKTDYYSGKLSQEELIEYGWGPMNLRILKSDIYEYVDADKDVLHLGEQREEMQEIVDSCTMIIKELNNRTWQLKEYMGWQKFIQGA